MLTRFCVAKIHRATVTEAELNYIGSITIDEVLLEKSGIRPFQMVSVHNLSNAAAWQTYAIAGAQNSGTICLNGPPARLFQPGDKVIIIADAYLEPSEADDLRPLVVFVDEKNRVTKVERHPARASNPGATERDGAAVG